jgi:hypothetical protein
MGPTNRFERQPQSTPATPSPEGFGQVFDLAVARAKRAQSAPPPIPSSVWDEMDAASRLYDALAAQGHELRFEAGAPGEAVRAELRSEDGTVVRLVTLGEAVDFDGGPTPAA